MFVQVNHEILEILNDDVLFILRKHKINSNEPNVILYKRDGKILEAWMNEYSLVLYSKFIMDEDKWENLKYKVDN